MFKKFPRIIKKNEKVYFKGLLWHLEHCYNLPVYQSGTATKEDLQRIIDALQTSNINS